GGAGQTAPPSSRWILQRLVRAPAQRGERRAIATEPRIAGNRERERTVCRRAGTGRGRAGADRAVSAARGGAVRTASAVRSVGEGRSRSRVRVRRGSLVGIRLDRRRRVRGRR